VSGCLLSLSFRGVLVSNADCIKARDWSQLTSLSTFGDASYLLMIGPPPYPAFDGKEAFGMSGFSPAAPTGCSDEFKTAMSRTFAAAQEFLLAASELPHPRERGFPVQRRACSGNASGVPQAGRRSRTRASYPSLPPFPPSSLSRFSLKAQPSPRWLRHRLPIKSPTKASLEGLTIPSIAKDFHPDVRTVS